MIFAKHWAATLDDYAIDLAWSPDGTTLAAASAAGGITLFDAATGAVQHTLPGHADGANCLAWCPTAGELATGGQDGCVKFWSAATGAELAETKLGGAWVEHLAWIAAPATSGDAAPSPRSPRAEGGAAPAHLLFAAAGKKLVALHADGTLAHIFPDAPKTISALAPTLHSTAAAPSAADSSGVPPSALRVPPPLLATACFGHVAVWNAQDFSAHKEFSYGNAIYALTWSPDRRWLVAGCHDNAVHLWAPAEDLELHMSGYETRLKELSFSHDSKWLATGGGRDACVWDCSGAGPEGREPLLLPHTTRVVAVAFQNSHGLLATGTADGEFSLWAPARKNPLIAEVKMPAAATKFAWRADDSLLAVGTAKGHVFVFKTA
jgi:WD40 repeat protein